MESYKYYTLNTDLIMNKIKERFGDDYVLAVKFHPEIAKHKELHCTFAVRTVINRDTWLRYVLYSFLYDETDC